MSPITKRPGPNHHDRDVGRPVQLDQDILITLANQGLGDPDELQATAVGKFFLE